MQECMFTIDEMIELEKYKMQRAHEQIKELIDAANEILKDIEWKE